MHRRSGSNARRKWEAGNSLITCLKRFRSSERRARGSANAERDISAFRPSEALRILKKPLADCMNC